MLIAYFKIADISVTSNQHKAIQMQSKKVVFEASSRQRLSMANTRLQKSQKFFSYGVVLIPLAGTSATISLLGYTGVTKLDIAVLIVMYALTMAGITVGYHRLFSHKAFQTNTTVKVILAILGCMSGQGHVIHWVSNHRRHHQSSDRLGDPHSPHVCQDGKVLNTLNGFWHSQIGWLVKSDFPNVLLAKDWLKDSAVMKVNRLYLVWVFLGFAIPGIAGGVLSGTSMGMFTGVLWGGFIRVFLVHHAISSINSITHLFGNRAFQTSDRSQNNLWLAIPTGGEAWHNNHHAFPNSAIFGLKWWQIDPGAWIVLILEKLGLVWDVRQPTTNMMQVKEIAKA